MANISGDDGLVIFTQPNPGRRFNSTRRQFETVGPYVLAASRARIDTFLESLPALSLTDLPEDNIECPICTEPYRVSRNSDIPVRLPCSHIVGKDCLSKWLNSSVRNANNNTCPLCRAILFNRYSPTVEPRIPTVHEVLASLRYDVLGYLRAQEHERTPREYNRIRNALNGFRARMDGPASREARGLIRLLNSHDPTLRIQLASLRVDVDRYTRAQQHERTFEEFRQINHALTELVPSLDGAAREDFFNLVRDLHRAYHSARPVQVQPVPDGRTEPINQNAPNARETHAPGGARDGAHGQEVANPMRAAPNGPERFDENDRATVREVPERGTARASSGIEELSDDSPAAGRARLRSRIEEMSRIQTLQDRNTPSEPRYPQMAAPRHARGIVETRADRLRELGTTDSRHASLIAEMGNYQRVVAEHDELLNRARAAQRPPHVVIPPGRGNSSRSTGIYGTPISMSEERRRAAVEPLDNRNLGIYATLASAPAERRREAAERSDRASTLLSATSASILAERRTPADEPQHTMPTRDPRTRTLAATPARPNQPQEPPQTTTTAAASSQHPTRANTETRFTIPRLEPTSRPREAPSRSSSSTSTTYAAINDQMTALAASMTRMENAQRRLAERLERLERDSVERMRNAGLSVREGEDEGGGVRERF